MLGIWGSIVEKQRLCATVAVVLLVLILTKGTCKIIDNILLKKPEVNKEIKENELNELGIKADIEFASTEDIENIFKNGFNKNGGAHFEK